MQSALYVEDPNTGPQANHIATLVYCLDYIKGLLYKHQNKSSQMLWNTNEEEKIVWLSSIVCVFISLFLCTFILTYVQEKVD